MAIVETFKNLFNDFVKAFDNTIAKTYIPDGFDVNDRYFNSMGEMKWGYWQEEEYFRNNSLTKASTIFGFSNRDLSKKSNSYLSQQNRHFKGADQSLPNIAKNFIGWQEKASIFRLIINFLIITPLNIILTPLRFLHNLLKIVTEVIPGTIAEFTIEQFKKVFGKAKNDYENKNYGSLAFTASAAFILFILHILSKNIYYIGCALTSPIDSIISVWKTSYGFPNSPFYGSKIYAYTFAGLAALGIAIIYTIALPLAIKALTLSLAPVISHHIPSLMNAIDKISNAVPQIFTSIGNFMLNHIGFISAPAKLLHVYSALTTIPAVVTIGAFIGLGLAIIGPPVNMVLDKIKTLWHSSSEQTVDVENAQPVSTQNTKHVTNSYSKVPSITPTPGSTPSVTASHSGFHPYPTTGKYSPPTLLNQQNGEQEPVRGSQKIVTPPTSSHQTAVGKKNNAKESGSYGHALYKGDSDHSDEDHQQAAYRA